MSLSLQFGKKIIRSYESESNNDECISRLLNLFNKVILNFESLINGRYKLNDIDTAIFFDA